MDTEDELLYLPRGLNRQAAARYIGVDALRFDAMITDGRMPRPKSIDGLDVWDRLAIDEAFSALPSHAPPMPSQDDESETPPRGAEVKNYTPRTLAAAWGCSERHIRNLCASGELRSFKLGEKRIRRADVERYEISQEIPAGAPAADTAAATRPNLLRTTRRDRTPLLAVDNNDLVVSYCRLEVDPDRNASRLEQGRARIFSLIRLVEDHQDFDVPARSRCSAWMIGSDVKP